MKFEIFFIVFSLKFSFLYSFKQNELDDLANLPDNISFSYLLLWDCILNFCAKAPAEIRSIYAQWISVHGFQDVSECAIICSNKFSNFLLYSTGFPRITF
jgi:hypothetical protein